MRIPLAKAYSQNNNVPFMFYNKALIYENEKDFGVDVFAVFGTVSKVECFKCSGNGCAEPVGFNKGIYCGAKQYTISCVFVKGQKRELDFYGGFIGQKENARYHNSSKN